MIAFDGGRWGAARLVKPLHDAGFRVAALCPSGNSLARTGYLDQYFALTDVRSSRRFESRLAEIMGIWKPLLIVPADERVVACLHAVVRKARSGGLSRLDEAALAIIVASLGNPARFDAMLLKSSTLGLARELGLPVPGGETVISVDQAIAAANRIGFPVYVKASFSWSGNGVSFCRNGGEIAAAIAATRPRLRLPFRDALRRAVNRDWYPAQAAIDVQESIAGTPAMFCAVALNGRMIAGFAGITRQACAVNGPSSIVRIGANPEMERISREIIRVFGASGFIGFDFMIDGATGAIVLLECNPRPIPVCHLGSRIGVDLCAALAAEFGGKPYSAAARIGEEVITLFPHEWQRNPDGVAKTGNYIDIPLDDPELLRLMINASFPRNVRDRAESAPVATRGAIAFWRNRPRILGNPRSSPRAIAN